MKTVAALYVEPDSVYLQFPQVDPWTKERNAIYYDGTLPVVAHPPCQQWSRLKAFAKVDPEQKKLALIAFKQVVKCGGVLEHPKDSTLFKLLPRPGKKNQFGFTISICQNWFGHRARKETWLFISGIKSPKYLPEIPYSLEVKHPVQSMAQRERNRTPKAFAQWLIAVAVLASKKDDSDYESKN